MKKQTEYDEKQQIDRGNAYKNSYVILLILLFIDYLIKDIFKINWLNSKSTFMILFWVSVSVCEITIITKNAYDGISDHSGRIFLLFQGIFGLAILSISLIQIQINEETLYSAFGSIFMGVCCIIICAVYWIKVIRDKNSPET